MYIDNGINYGKMIRDMNVFIFGGGKRGSELLSKLKRIGISKIGGIIDNDKTVVKEYNSRLIKAYMPEQYLDVKTEKDIIIISTHYTEIQEQLFKMGIFNFVLPEQIDFSVPGEAHYDSDYFDFQIECAKIDSVIDRSFFQKYIEPSDSVAEFGCGGGLLLDKLTCKSKVGIEINPYAREYAKSLQIDTVKNIDDLENEMFDLIISTHALEHCLNPYQIISQLKSKLKDGGKFVFVVPYEPLDFSYVLNDNSQHLYIWTERTLGNLMRAAGLYVRETGVREVEWPNKWKELFGEVSFEMFNELSVLESNRTGYYSVYVVAEK